MIFDGKPFVPHPNGRLLTPYTLDMEREFHEVRTDLARQYGALNRLNRVTVRSADDWIGIAACGHTYHELREALPAARVRRRRRAPRRRHPPVPAADAGPARPARRARVRPRAHRVIVVEEKNPTLELLVSDALYDVDRPSRVCRASATTDGQSLVPDDGLLDADRDLAAPLRLHLGARSATASRPSRLAPRPRR